MLKQLLDQGKNFNPSYGKAKFSNHLPMALIALHKLGASNKQLSRFYETYSKKLEPISHKDVHTPFHLSNWKNTLGISDYYSDYFIFFKETIQAIGIQSTLKQFLPHLIDGLATQAFHCLIRLAYSVEINDKEEVARALAYFASEYVILEKLQNVTSSAKSPDIILEKIHQSKALCDKKFKHPTLIERMQKASSLHDFAFVNQDLASTDFSLEQCANTVIKLYATTGDFAVLHMVTALHALRILFPYLQSTHVVMRYYWQAVCAAYVSIGAPSFPKSSDVLMNAEQLYTWPEIFSHAADSLDDHLIKLIYTCHEEALFYQDTLYQKVASKRVLDQLS